MSFGMFGEKVIPPAYRPLGWFWYTVHMSEFVWRPGGWLSSQLDSAKRDTGLAAALAAGSVIGLHVRHGDACGDAQRTARACSPLSDYMVEVDKLRQQSGTTTVYLATDSDDIFAAAPLQYPSYTWLRWNESLSYQNYLFADHPGVVWDDIISLNRHDGKTEVNERVARLASIDMFLLAQCDYFVGKFTSNFFRIAYELKAAQCDCAPPFVSLDAPWCFDFAAEIGKSRATLSNGSYADKLFLC